MKSTSVSLCGVVLAFGPMPVDFGRAGCVPQTQENPGRPGHVVIRPYNYWETRDPQPCQAPFVETHVLVQFAPGHGQMPVRGHGKQPGACREFWNSPE